LFAVEGLVGDVLVGLLGGEPGERTEAAGPGGPGELSPAFGGGLPLPPAGDVLDGVDGVDGVDLSTASAAAPARPSKLGTRVSSPLVPLDCVGHPAEATRWSSRRKRRCRRPTPAVCRSSRTTTREPVAQPSMICAARTRTSVHNGGTRALHEAEGGTNQQKVKTLLGTRFAHGGAGRLAREHLRLIGRSGLGRASRGPRVNGQFVVPAGGQVKVPGPGVVQLFVAGLVPFVRAWRMR
jgi:hypothetical protein